MLHVHVGCGSILSVLFLLSRLSGFGCGVFSARVCFLCVEAASVFVNSASVVFRRLSSGHGLHTHNTANNDRRQAKIAEETRRTREGEDEETTRAGLRKDRRKDTRMDGGKGGDDSDVVLTVVLSL